MEGSDHAPVYMSLVDIPNIQQYNTPSLSTRYCPQVYGYKQTLVSMFARKQSAEHSNLSGGSSSILENNIAVEKCCQLDKRSLNSCSSASLDSIHKGVVCTLDACYKDLFNEASSGSQSIRCTKSSVVCRKKQRQSQSSQLSLKSFFQKTASGTSDLSSICSDKEPTQEDIFICEPNKTSNEGGEQDDVKELQVKQGASEQEGMPQAPEKENKNTAFIEWQRIRHLMQTSIPLCKGHKEPCVSRIVKKPGPTSGQQFYVCARAEGPASNPEAYCGFFTWATVKVKSKR